MLNQKNVGVFLKNIPLDDAVLEFAAHFADDPDRKLFLGHVTNPNDPECGPAPSAQEFEKMVRDRLPATAHGSLTTAVLKGDQIEQILRAARDRNLDLMVLGRMLPSSQLGLGARIARIVRKSPCSVLIVPELCRPHFDRTLAAVDCSDHSRLALEAAIEIARHASGKPQVIATMVRQVPTNHDLAGVSFTEAAERQRVRGRESLESFIQSVDHAGIDIEPLVLLSSDPALALTHAAMAKKVDIVVAGSRGSSSTAAALLGATSERLLVACAAPTLIVKKKGETLGLLEALFTMR